MPTVTIPNVSDGGDIVAETVFAMFNDPVTPANSLSVINGALWTDNLKSTTKIAAEHTQRGSAVRGLSSSGTANLDYRWTWFGDYATGAVTSFTINATTPHQYIPGGCAPPFYVPWDDSSVLVMWQIYFFNDHYFTANPRSDIHLVVDNSAAGTTGLRRSVVWGGNPESVAGDTNTVTPTAYRTARAWSGHCLVELPKGWHNVGLALLADGTGPIRNTRIHAASMSVLLLKRGT